MADLPGGRAMPLLGFGTWQLKGGQATEATGWALEAGYRHLDTATMYGNEREVGAALAASGLAREEVFVTTKLPPDHAGRELDTLRQSLDMLGTSYVDLWLIHWPPSGTAGGDIWTAFAEARQQGLVHDIGVSNYSFDQIDEVTKATGVLPAVNQIRWSPLIFDRAVLDGHRARDIVLEGYSGLKGGALTHPTITGMAQQRDRTPAQIIVRWHLQHGTVVIPKSTNRDRIVANASVGDFTLTEHDMSALDSLAAAG